jgi:CHAT domain-containing protein
MHTTPGEEALPGVSKEISEVRAVVETSWSVKSEEGPNADTVLNELKKCEIAHFACHGLSDFANPSNSHLILQKFQSPGSAPVRDLLTVRQISEIDLKHAKIAYLSACSTAENKAQNLVDEVLHLASGFQVAGFGHVIATMWPAGDDVCVEVAKTFYSQIVKSWGGGKSYDAIAAALHTSTMKIREKYRRQPLAWAQFIHSGV